MKKLLLLSATCLVLGACGSFHTKQPIDDTYYKKTQSVAWPEGTPSANTTAYANGGNGASNGGGAGYGASGAAGSKLNWQDPKTVDDQKVAIPAMPEKKLQCVKTDRNTYTCRLGQYQCGTGCKSDGSNCRNGYCLQSDCDDVMGQKWELAYHRSNNLYGCQHPTAKVLCYPYPSIHCYNYNSYYNLYETCGYDCNKNGTQCASGSDTCWAKYRDV